WTVRKYCTGAATTADDIRAAIALRKPTRKAANPNRGFVISPSCSFSAARPEDQLHIVNILASFSPVNYRFLVGLKSRTAILTKDRVLLQHLMIPRCCFM